MDAMYYKDHIMDELEGACDYIKKAIELKAMDAAMSKIFADMSAVELDHAAKLFKMFGEYFVKVTSVYKEAPEYLAEIQRDLAEYYPEKSAVILRMHDMYKK